MTTNQTIDGVPREQALALCNVVEVAVKLEKEAFAKGTSHVEVSTFRALRYALDHLSSVSKVELRALLDAPAENAQWVSVEAFNRVSTELEELKAAQPQENDQGGFWQWLDSAYRDGSKGEEPRFTKYNMEVAYHAGANAAQPQGEPVAWVVLDNGFIDDHTVVKTVADEWEDRGLEVTTLYAEQPAPVAMVKTCCGSCSGGRTIGNKP